MRETGFVYIWFDRLRRMYYVGSHVENGKPYICSSEWMLNAFAQRPADFKRRVLKNLEFDDRTILRKEEQRYLDMIKKKELGKRYYNLMSVVKEHWGDDEYKRLSMAQRISLRKKQSFQRLRDAGEETHSKEWRAGLSKARKGHVMSDEQKARIKASMRRYYDQNDGPMKGKKLSIEHRAAISAGNIGRVFTTATRASIASANSKRYEIVRTDGLIEIAEGLKAYSRELGIPYVTLRKALESGSGIRKYGIRCVRPV